MALVSLIRIIMKSTILCTDVWETANVWDYEWTEKVSVYVLGKPFQPSVMQHASLLGQIISYKENEVILNTAHVSLLIPNGTLYYK